MATLNITGVTGKDDLRSNCWANLTVKVVGQTPKEFPRFTGYNGLRSNQQFKISVDLAGVADPNQIEYFQIEHVSHEDFGQTRDNWDLESATFDLKLGRFPVKIAELDRPYRFTGSSATLLIYPVEG